MESEMEQEARLRQNNLAWSVFVRDALGHSCELWIKTRATIEVAFFA